MTTTTTPLPAADAPPVERFAHRSALDGIRALAVVAVVVYHLGYRWLPGGFLGVDAFFVLSGYLITSLLLVEHAATGRIVLHRFWTRRIRRLMPPMLLVVGAVCVYAGTVASDEVRYSLRGDSLATLLYVANWRFIVSGQSYFAEFSDPSPLRHMWSLAIEEQFYLLWPLAVLLALWLARGRAKVLAAVVAVGIAGSVTAMAVLGRTGASRAYYGTDSRIHELLVGALLALALRRTGLGAPGRRWTWNGVALGGLIAVAASFVVVTDASTGYYRGGSLAFAVAVAALILGLEKGSGGPATGLLSHPAVVWVGAVSYGLYIFHWPIILWVDESLTGLRGTALDAFRVALLVAVTAASYYLLERPIRRGRFLGLSLTPVRVFAIAPVLLALVAGAAVAGTRGAAPPDWAIGGKVGQIRVLGSTDPNAPTLAVVGDSIAKGLQPALGEVGAQQGIRVIGGAWVGCGIAGTFQVDQLTKQPFDFSQDCDDAIPRRYADLVRDYDPDVVFMESVRERMPMRTADGRIVEPGTPEHRALVLQGLEQSYRALSARGATIVISKVVPRGKRHYRFCQEPENVGRCAADGPGEDNYGTMDSIIEEFAARHPGVVVYDFPALVCPGGPPCPDEINGMVLRWDGSHFTHRASEWVAPRLLRQIEQLTDLGSARRRR